MLGYNFFLLVLVERHYGSRPFDPKDFVIANGSGAVCPILLSPPEPWFGVGSVAIDDHDFAMVRLSLDVVQNLWSKP